MKIAGMNITFRHYPISYFFDCMDRIGIKDIEFWAGEPHLFVYRNVMQNIRILKKELRSRNMNMVCFTPEQCVYPYNIASSDKQWRRASVHYFLDNMHAALELESTKMLLTSGIGDFAISAEESLKMAADSLYELSKAAEQEGMTLCLEPLTRFETNLITDLHGLRAMLQEIQSPALKGMIDTVAMHLAGETVEDYFALLPELGHFHLIDGDGESDAHLSLDDGVLPWRNDLKCLKEHGYQGACTLEIMGSAYYQNPEQAVMNSLKKIEEMSF